MSNAATMASRSALVPKRKPVDPDPVGISTQRSSVSLFFLSRNGDVKRVYNNSNLCLTY